MPIAHRIALITDSTSDLPDHLLDKHDIHMVPQVLVWGKKKQKDRIDISPEEFYQRLENSDVIPTTSQPVVQDYRQTYRKAQEQNAEEIVVITNSKVLSGSFNAATEAAEKVGIPVHIVDGGGPSMSLGWQVIAAARAREGGANAEGMIAAADRVRDNLVQLIVFDSLDVLYKSGRMGFRAFWFGSTFQLKPILRVNHTQGVLKPFKQIRTRKRSLNYLYKRFFKELKKNGKGPFHISVFHGNASEEAEAFAERIRVEQNPEELIVGITGPVLGTHTGPGVISIAGYVE